MNFVLGFVIGGVVMYFCKDIVNTAISYLKEKVDD